MSLLLLATCLLCAPLLIAQQPVPGPATIPIVGASGKVRLVYEMPPAAGAQAGVSGAADALLLQLRDRIAGDARLVGNGPQGFAVELENADPARVRKVRRLIETAGKLEFRAVAGLVQRKARSFDLDAERRRLLDWLDAGGRSAVLADDETIAAFHERGDSGPLAGTNLRWVPHRIEMDLENAGHWQVRLADTVGLRDAVVAVYTDEDWHGGVIPRHIQALPAERRFLLELVAVDRKEVCFTAAEFDARAFRVVKGGKDPAMRLLNASQAPVRGGEGGSLRHPDSLRQPVEDPALCFRVRGDQAGMFADWSEMLLGSHFVMLWDDRVLGAPRVECRVAGEGVITGVLSPAQALVVRAALQGPALAGRPYLVKQESFDK